MPGYADTRLLAGLGEGVRLAPMEVPLEPRTLGCAAGYQPPAPLPAVGCKDGVPLFGVAYMA